MQKRAELRCGCVFSAPYLLANGPVTSDFATLNTAISAPELPKCLKFSAYHSFILPMNVPNVHKSPIKWSENNFCIFGFYVVFIVVACVILFDGDCTVESGIDCTAKEQFT